MTDPLSKAELMIKTSPTSFSQVTGYFVVTYFTGHKRIGTGTDEI